MSEAEMSPNRCPACDVICLNEWELIQHKTLKHECAICGLLLAAEREILIHVLQVHEVGESRDLGCGDAAPFIGIVNDQYVAGPYAALELDVELLRIARKRLPGDPWPTDPLELAKWIYPMCCRLTTSDTPDLALWKVPEGVKDQARYVESNWICVRKAIEQDRFRRLHGAQSRAMFLAKSLARPDLSPGRAEQLLKGIKFEPCS